MHAAYLILLLSSLPFLCGKTPVVVMIHILEGTVFIDNIDEFLHKIKETSKEKNVVLQAFCADKLAGEEHIRFAVEKAMNAFKSGNSISNDLAKEIMLYAAGTRSIIKALKLGIHSGQNNIVLVSIGDGDALSAFNEIQHKPVLAYDDSKKDAIMGTFNITTEEIEAAGIDKIPELVLERVALVDVIK